MASNGNSKMETDMDVFKEIEKERKIARLAFFVKHYLPILKLMFKVNLDKRYTRYSFTDDKWGVINFYPVSNTFLIRKQNRWFTNGLKRLITRYGLNAGIPKEVDDEC